EVDPLELVRREAVEETRAVLLRARLAAHHVAEHLTPRRADENDRLHAAVDALAHALGGGAVLPEAAPRTEERRAVRDIGHELLLARPEAPDVEQARAFLERERRKDPASLRGRKRGDPSGERAPLSQAGEPSRGL